jgi:hypothetical protein
MQTETTATATAQEPAKRKYHRRYCNTCPRWTTCHCTYHEGDHTEADCYVCQERLDEWPLEY